MADSKVESLTKRVINSLASITGVRLWSGKDGEDDAQGVEMSEMISSEIVTEGSTIDYKGITPKAFALSTASTTRKGIVEIATATEIKEETSLKVITSDKQSDMRKYWGTADGDANNGRAKIYHSDLGKESDQGHNFIFPVNFYFNGDGGSHIFYPFDLTSLKTGLRLQYLTITGIYGMIGAKNKIDNVFLDATSGAELRFNNDAGFRLVIPGSTAPPYIQITGITGTMMLSMTVHALAF